MLIGLRLKNRRVDPLKKFWSIIVMVALIVAPCVIVHTSFGSSAAATTATNSTTKTAMTVVSAGDHGDGGVHEHSDDLAHIHSDRLPAVDQNNILNFDTGLLHGHDHDDDSSHDCEQNCNGWMTAGASNSHARLTLLHPGTDRPTLPPASFVVAFHSLSRQFGHTPYLALHRSRQTGSIIGPSVLERTARLRI